MKLRFSGDSIRFRLSPQDVAALRSDGIVSETLPVGPRENFSYTIRVRPEQAAVTASLVNSGVCLDLPEAIASNWIDGDEVAIEGQQDCGGGRRLRILIEKDFECLHRESEAERKLFPNPRKEN